MSALPYIAKIVIPAAFTLLEEIARDLKHRAAGRLANPDAHRIMLAIGLQESGFEHRRQMVRGPARSFYQAEPTGGFRGVITHPATRDLAREVLKRAGYGEPDPSDFEAIEHGDIVSSCGARLLLYTHPHALPGPVDEDAAKLYYRDTWRPGHFRPEKWPGSWAGAIAELNRL